MNVPELSQTLALSGLAKRADAQGAAAANASGTGRQELVKSGKEFPRPTGAAPESGALQRAAELVEQYLKDTSRNLRFQVDADTGVNIFTVVDANTGEIVRQVPSEEVLATALYISEHAGDVVSGALLDART